jgi:tRNA A37 threonylcarbamoyladenosine modification protein TsaB
MKNVILFTNPLARLNNISILSDIENTIYEMVNFEKHDIASTLPRILGDLYKKYTIKEIWCVTGPGPFTLMRVVCLALNALAFGEDIKIKGCHLFALIPE